MTDELVRTEKLIDLFHIASARELETGNDERADKFARVAAALRRRLIREGKAA